MEYLCKLCSRNCSEEERQRCWDSPKLNLGSGSRLSPVHINFDCVQFHNGSLSTDILGDARNLTQIFQENTFANIYCTHVLEHFVPGDGARLLQDCFRVLRSRGTLVVEAPDIGKICEMGSDGSFPIQRIIQEIYGDPLFLENLGDQWSHKWGWTADLCADQMEKVGFVITKRGDGISHHRPDRDFRVEGEKP